MNLLTRLSIPLNGFLGLWGYISSKFLVLSIPLNGFAATAVFMPRLATGILSIPLNGFEKVKSQRRRHESGLRSFNSIERIH